MEEIISLASGGGGGGGVAVDGSGGSGSSGGMDAGRQQYEVFVQGVLHASKLSALKGRLQALCDHSLDAATDFDFDERIYNAG